MTRHLIWERQPTAARFAPVLYATPPVIKDGRIILSNGVGPRVAGDPVEITDDDMTLAHAAARHPCPVAQPEIHSGPDQADWARSLRDQCVAAGVPFFFKQWGEWIGVPDLRNLPGGTGPGFGAFDHHTYDQDHETVRVGKKAAGRLLDGRTWDQFPGDA